MCLVICQSTILYNIRSVCMLFNKTITIHMYLLFIQRYSFQFPEFSNLSNSNLLNQLICAILWLLFAKIILKTN